MSSGNDAMTWTCAFAHAGFFCRFLDLRYRYELGVVNSRNEFDHARSAAVQGGCLDAHRRFFGPACVAREVFGWLTDGGTGVSRGGFLMQHLRVSVP